MHRNKTLFAHIPTMLDSDSLRSIASASAEVAFRMSLVCVEWRKAVQEGEGAPFEAMRSLLTIGHTSLLSDLVSSLYLSPRTVRVYPHRLKRRHGGGNYKIFEFETAVAIFASHGGFAKLEERMARKRRA